MSGVSRATSDAAFAASAGVTDVEAVGPRPLLGAAARPRADEHVEAAVAKVARMGAALAAIADHRDRARSGRIGRHRLRCRSVSTGFSFVAQKKTPRSGWERGALGFRSLLDLYSEPGAAPR